jgi:hypothetical protein
MTICEAEIDGVPVVIVPEKAQAMLRALGWTPPSDPDADVTRGWPRLDRS